MKPAARATSARIFPLGLAFRSSAHRGVLRRVRLFDPIRQLVRTVEPVRTARILAARALLGHVAAI